MANYVIGVEPYDDGGMPLERVTVVSINGSMRASGQPVALAELSTHPLYPQLVAYVNAHPVAAKAS